MLRYELKYFVPNDKLDLLKSLISPFVQLDPYAASLPGKEYTVRSIYFETPDFMCYHTKIAGIKNRIKVRVRGYNEEDPSNIVFMEIKRKFESPIYKHRAPVTFLDIQRIFKGENSDDLVLKNDSFKESQADAKRFLYNMYSLRMQPVVKVIYEREPWLSRYKDKENNLRVTLDKNLRSTAYPTIDKLYEEKDVRNALNEQFILEVKFNRSYPSWMRPIIGSLGLRRESASKYCICIDALPEIDVNSGYATYSHGRIFKD